MAGDEGVRRNVANKAHRPVVAGSPSVAVAAVGLVVATTLLAGCAGKDTVPADDEYQGNSGESMAAPSSSAPTDNADSSSLTRDTGKYRDGTYHVDGQLDPVGKDTIDVSITVAKGDITDVSVVGHTSNDISKRHQAAFIEAIPGVVVGKPLKGLKVDKVAGASWTTQAFNDALDNARDQASVQ
ncbi:MAG: FMN-binding protein [Bifidobacterium sp.]|jgi:uncharacterized protein with FMN-binding domain|nr:FMN-binding protein [Bifidobacterium sp.]